jgi:hypothetical protein
MRVQRIQQSRSSPAGRGAVLVGLAVGLAGALLLPAALAQPAIPNVLGVYRGFAQSDADPGKHSSITMTLDSQRDSRFTGVVEIVTATASLVLELAGKMPLEGAGTMAAGGGVGAGKAKFTEFVIKDLAQGGALARASYKTTFPDGSVDKGTLTLLRSPVLPDPCPPGDRCLPPDVAGVWRGTSASDLDGRETPLDLEITGQDGTSFEGCETVGGIVPCTKVVGTVGVGGQLVYIGAGPQGTVLAAGPIPNDGEPTPNDGLEARYVRAFATSLDLGTLTLRRIAR